MASFAQDLMRHLPVEVVALTFQHYVLANESPMIFGKVCQDWRAIAWHQPSLWTRIRFGNPPYCGWHVTLKCREHLELASEWLARSGTLPLHVEIHWPINGPEASRRIDEGEHTDEPVTVLEKELFGFVKTFAARWNILALYFIPNNRLREFFSENNRFTAPMLAKIRIESDSYQMYGGPSNFFPPLHLSGCSPSHLVTGYMDLSLIQTNWENLSYFSFFFGDLFGPDELLDVLCSAPNLECCKALGSYRYVERRRDSRVRNHPVTHAKLQTFRLIFDNPLSRQDLGRFFFRAKFPSLQTMHFGCSEISDTPLFAAFLCFIGKSTALTTLNLENITATLNMDYFVKFLRTRQNLQTLGIYNCPSLISDLFFLRLTEDNDNQTIRPFLPSLRTFNYFGSQTFSWAAFQQILRRMEAPPRNISMLRECTVYVDQEIEMEEALKHRLETLPNAKVRKREDVAADLDALLALGFQDKNDDDNEPFC